ncbi:thioesterase family protein [Sphaerisporangium sp. B11E5]|uniref:acyl-CoA thioesterase n=1 Tax=Sphaerisporangium sp. B11E5 TaxID=3153563 RepID=UPI00325F2F02
MTVQPQSPAPSAPVPLAGHGHVQPMTVYYDDLDAMGLVHNCRYAIILERALSEFWTGRGFTNKNGASNPDAFLVVAEFSIKYRIPVRGTGQVDVHFHVERLGDTSAVYAFRFVSPDGSTVHAEGRRVHIRMDPATLRPTSWTPPARAVLQELLQPQ